MRGSKFSLQNKIELNGTQQCIAKIGAGPWNFSFGPVSATVRADVFQLNIGC